ncbi:MAG: cell wall metabolism sensor histidine kinase WalK [Chloroflexi bacterium]|nr:cell wall metabolism sensor histidine kinase WalK [Chloroflexota bacterium]
MFGRISQRIAIPYLALIFGSMLTLGICLEVFGYRPDLTGVIVVIFALVMAVLAVVLAILVARSITKPIEKLTMMARQLAASDLDQAVKVSSGDEIEELAWSFNQMAERTKRTIDSLSSERNRIVTLLSRMADGVVITGHDGRVALVNPAAAKILGISSDVVLGRSFIKAVRDHELHQLWQRCQQSGEQFTELIRLGPASRFVRVTAMPVKEGAFTSGLVLLQDVSELRRLETTRREFVANISHELRTPLASLKLLVETLEEGALLEEPTTAREFLGKIHLEIDKLTQLVRELLELSRIESGQVPLKWEALDIGHLIEEAVGHLRPQAERQGIELKIVASPPLPRLYADGERVQQVIVNLVHNAIKFTPPGGKVEVLVRPQSEAVVISVIDTGVGIPGEDLPRIFERFYKADKSRSSGGTGLGLAIAKHIVQAHGGRIWAESVEGQGSTFSFTLPLTTGA